jgi:hypothetical protein
MRRLIAVGSLSLISLATLSCENKPSGGLAPSASAFEAPKPPPGGAQTFAIDTASSNVGFTMDAELEKISGRAPGALEGRIYIDPKDISRSSGVIRIDLDKLSIYQKKRESGDKEFGTETKNEKQNKDMRVWFEIESDAPAEAREKNRWVEFKIGKIDEPSVKDLSALSGAERKVTLKVSGDLRLHQRIAPKSAKLEATFRYEGDKPISVAIKTLEPFGVGLGEHDVRPRSAFGKLADKTLETLGAKVAKVALVTFELNARAQ